VDPWSGLPSPTRSGTPRRDSEEDAATQSQNNGGVVDEAARRNGSDSGDLNGLIGA
jgi:hypothetical protein